MSGTVPSPPLPPIPTGVSTSPYVSIGQFRLDYPVFNSTTVYPDVMIQMFLDVGSVLVRQSRWGSMTAFGVELFTAHMLALQQMAAAGASGPGSIPGQARGLQTAKAVSKVSVSYDYSMVGIENGGTFNLTIYGTQFLWWAELFGTGGYEVLGDTYPDSLAGTVWTWSTGVMMRWGS
jgi:hypothetical protein